MHTDTKTPWFAVITFPTLRPSDRKHSVGDGRDVLLQAFHWQSHTGSWHNGQRRCWYRILQDNAAAIKQAGFTLVWFPPPSDSLAPEGYIPRRWNVLNTAFGNEQELRTAIQAMAPLPVLGDVILNHRVGVATSGADFEDPRFPDNRAAVTRDDDSGIGTGNPDTGEHYAAGRDLDHTNPGVRETIKTYLNRLKEVGFNGWRYDLVKGYHGRFVAEYNDATDPVFSVGEFFDGDRQKLTNWIDSTSGKSTAFDFPTRYRLYEGCVHDDFGGLRAHHAGRNGPSGLIGMWPSRSVTFLDNHDTESRRDREHERHNDGTRHFPGATVAMGYAYILTHPGIPCVFWPHLFDWGPATRQALERLIRVRRALDIHARSGVDIKEARKGLYVAIIDNKVAVKLGSQSWSPGWGWQLAADGERFAVWARC
jgi:alpha-amylase